jgi:hypothetical protein
VFLAFLRTLMIFLSIDSSHCYLEFLFNYFLFNILHLLVRNGWNGGRNPFWITFNHVQLMPFHLPMNQIIIENQQLSQQQNYPHTNRTRSTRVIFHQNNEPSSPLSKIDKTLENLVDCKTRGIH